MTEHYSKNDKQNYGWWIGIGIEFGGVIVIFCYMGYKLDEALGTSPVRNPTIIGKEQFERVGFSNRANPGFFLGGFFTAFAGMLYLIIKEARKMQDK